MIVAQKQRRLLRRVVAALLAGLVVAGAWWGVDVHRSRQRVEALRKITLPDYVTVDLIETENTARSGQSLEDLDGIVIHYVGNPGTTAQNNRDYFNNPGTEVVSHFVVGLHGEILQCLPLWEQSVASNRRNRDTISIEVCHPDDSGQFSPITYAALVRLTAWLCRMGDLSTKQVIRHYDVSGKECPRYYVQHEEAWEQFLTDVETRYVKTNG